MISLPKISSLGVPFWLAAILLGALLVPGLADPVPGGMVLLVKSANIPEYTTAAKGIADKLRESSDDLVIKQTDLGSKGQDEKFWNEIKASGPVLVISIGTQATRGALQHCTDLPVVFTMVLNQPDLSSNSSIKRDIGGVTLNIPVDSQFQYLKKALPATRRVGFIYSPEADSAFQAASKSAKSQGLQLVVEKANSERDVPDAVRRMLSEIDAFWMPPDKMMYENIVFRFVVLECFKNGIPIISVYRHRAKAGIPLAIGVDYEDIGRQTAELVLRRLKGDKFTQPVIEQPRKLLLYINDGVVSNLNIKIPDEMIGLTVSVRSGS